MYETTLTILKKLNNKGYSAYIVGGYARDKYLNLKNNDIDICTQATPEEISNIFFVKKIFFQFGVCIIEENGYLFEMTTFRKESDYEKFRYPKKIEFVKTIEEDLLRRDFIINTLCIDQSGKYIDFLNAQEDLNNKIIRTVGEADLKIKEDAIRILRALKYSIKLDFKIDSKIWEAIKKNYHNLTFISKDKIQKEMSQVDLTKLKKILKENNFFDELSPYLFDK